MSVSHFFLFESMMEEITNKLLQVFVGTGKTCNSTYEASAICSSMVKIYDSMTRNSNC